MHAWRPGTEREKINPKQNNHLGIRIHTYNLSKI